MSDSNFKFASVLAFCGESGNGKSTIAKLFQNCLKELGFKAEFATKYISGRKRREVEDPGVKIVDSVPTNCLKGSPRKGEEIGYDLDEIKQMLDNGVFPIIITKDIRFLANLVLVLNPKSNCVTELYKGRNLPIVRTRIYDIQSNTLSNEEITNLEIERNPGLEREEILSQTEERVTSWQPYYKDRFGSSGLIERVTNIKNIEHMKKYIKENLIGVSENDDKTLLGYKNLWKDSDEFDNTGIILHSYINLVNNAESYLQKQLTLDQSNAEIQK